MTWFRSAQIVDILVVGVVTEAGVQAVVPDVQVSLFKVEEVRARAGARAILTYLRRCSRVRFGVMRIAGASQE
jgi:hypothetical protein